jgi:hypothetical protein
MFRHHAAAVSVVVYSAAATANFGFCPAFAPIPRHHCHDPAVGGLADSG